MLSHVVKDKCIFKYHENISENKANQFVYVSSYKIFDQRINKKKILFHLWNEFSYSLTEYRIIIVINERLVLPQILKL